MKVDKKPEVVTIGGGTGHFTLIEAARLVTIPENITAIPGVTDNGGDTQRKRVDMGVLPPGDARRCILALVPPERQQLISDLLSYRDPSGSNMGNTIIATLEVLYGNQEAALLKALQIFNIPGRVIPVSHKSGTLVATLSNGEKLIGETKIDLRAETEGYNRNETIKSLALQEPLYLNPNAETAVKEEADIIAFAAGDLYSSILPHFLITGFTDALSFRKKSAKTVLCLNLMTKPGETDGFTASDFVKEIVKYSGNPRFKIDYVLGHHNHLPEDIVEIYRQKGQDLVDVTAEQIEEIKKLLPEAQVRVSDLVRDPVDGLIRHDPVKLAKAIRGCLPNMVDPFPRRIWNFLSSPLPVWNK